MTNIESGRGRIINMGNGEGYTIRTFGKEREQRWEKLMGRECG